MVGDLIDSEILRMASAVVLAHPLLVLEEGVRVFAVGMVVEAAAVVYLLSEAGVVVVFSAVIVGAVVV